jgi:hypothetical protein
MTTTEFFLAIFYLIIGFIAISKFGLYKYFGLSNLNTAWLFIAKAIFALAYLKIHIYLYTNCDSHRFHRDSLIIYNTFFSDFTTYLKLLLYPAGEYIPPDLNSYILKMKMWSDEGAYLIVRFGALANVFSFGSLYINSILYQFVTILGPLSIYKTFGFWYPNKKKMILLACVLPSVIFWTSGFHKDGLILTSLGLFFMCASSIVIRKFTWAKFIILLISAYVLLIIRGYELILMIPGLMALYWCFSYPTYRLLKFIICYSICIFLFFKLDSAINMGFTNFIIQKQVLFVTYVGNGNTSLNLLPLIKSGQSFIMQAPNAIYRALILPNFIYVHSKVESYYGIYNSLFLILLILMMFLMFINPKKIKTLSWFCLFFSLSIFLFVGWIVPNIGAMVRYTSVAVPFLCLFFILNINENWVKEQFLRISNIMKR